MKAKTIEYTDGFLTITNQNGQFSFILTLIAVIGHITEIAFVKQKEYNNIQKMFQPKIGREKRQIVEQKAKFCLKKSASSTLVKVSVKNTEIMPAVDLPQKSSDCVNEKLPKISSSVLKDIGNVENPTPSKGSYEIKANQVKKIEEILIQLRRSVNAYRFLQKEEVKAKQSIYVWFHEAEKVFLSALSGDGNSAETQKTLEDQMELRKIKPIIAVKELPKLAPSPPPNFYQQQAQTLRAELQALQIDRVEELKKIQEISQLFLGLKGKYNDEKQANSKLNEAMQFYIAQCDTMIERITAKYQKEKTITVLERQVQQVLTKLKFKTFDYHYRQ